MPLRRIKIFNGCEFKSVLTKLMDQSPKRGFIPRLVMAGGSPAVVIASGYLWILATKVIYKVRHDVRGTRLLGEFEISLVQRVGIQAQSNLHDGILVTNEDQPMGKPISWRMPTSKPRSSAKPIMRPVRE